MASASEIEWTEMTWNPVTGCTKLSAGCKNCYAETLAKRLRAMGAPGYEKGFRVSLHPERLEHPIARQKPTTYFVNSMSDLFHEAIPDSFIDEVLEVISKTPQHTYQILTKRAERLPLYFRHRRCPRNAWLGVSVENRPHGLPRISHLRAVAAPVRFLSIEPLLEHLGEIDLTGIHWVIVGGESGKKARPMAPQWVQDIRRQADDQGIAFFFKQWGSWGADGVKRSKKRNGRTLAGTTFNAMPAA